MGSKKIYIFALAALGRGISGSDRIFIEFSKIWSKDHMVTIYVWEEGYRMCQRQNLNELGIKCQVSTMLSWSKLGFLVNYFARIVEGVKIGLTIKVDNSKNTIIYSASEFWMDSLPGLVLKLRYPQITWAAAWYQTAPSPSQGFAESNRIKRYHLRAFLYWLMQLPIKPLIAKFADFVLVNNEEEKKQFPRHAIEKKAIVVLGAVDLKGIKSWKFKFRNLPKIYDAVFQGRFHPQKGVIELIEIWKYVVKKKPTAKLVMIGDGPLMKNVKFKIQNLKLEKNIILTGYLFDGEEKYRIFNQGKTVVHPAIFDSGGMSSMEAMAFGLPAVGFNLKSYEYYYPLGMIKVTYGSLEKFAQAILNLLSDNKLYNKMSREAIDLITEKMSWKYRSRQILNQVLE